MKTLNEILILGAFFGGILSPTAAYAEKMNVDTQDLVIKKMERVLSTLEKSDPAYLSSQQRLADLLSERARLRFMMEVEANCHNACKGSKEDRVKAVKIYESLLSSTKGTEHGPILFQLAHLYEMADQSDKAIHLYESIIKDAKLKKINPAIVSRAHVGLGDLLFQKNKFTEAKSHYQVALKDKQLENRSLTVYNLAWCDFNTDNLNGAIKTVEDLLKNPAQITRDTDEGSKFDGAFQTDVLRDLGTFYTKKEVTTRDINMYESLIPNEKRKELLLYFAKETDRIGQKKAAQQIMGRYLADNSLTKEERIEASVQMAQISYDQGQTGESLVEFTKAAAALQSGGCKEAKCEEFKKSMKHYVTEVHRSKKTNPDVALLNAYITYTQTFPGDKDMTSRAAQVAMQLNNYVASVQLYRTISESRLYSDKERAEALTNEVSAAEKSKDAGLQKEAYAHYLKYSDNETKSFEVKYQMAYLSYQEKQYQQAAEAFEDLAKTKKGNLELRKKAADLSLDCLLQVKNEKAMEALAWDYALIFPHAKAEYEGIARKTLMNKVARTANDSGSSKSDLKSSLSSLDYSKIQNASSTEKILFFNNRAVLAQKVDDEKAYVEAITALLAVPGLSKDQREKSLEQLSSFYEKRFDFKNAYATSLYIQDTKVSDKEREFRLGTLADFANLNAGKHYRKALQAGLSGPRSLMVRQRLVLTSENPVSELKKQARDLKQNPSLLNETALLVYGKTGDSKGLSSVLDMKEMRNKSATLFIKKQSFYGKVSEEGSKIAAHNLNLKNDRTLQKTIAERVALLKKTDKLLADSLALKDVTSQMMVLNIMATENMRMVRDLASLPLPANLSAKEKSQYISILKSQSKPFLYKAKVAHQKQQDVWNKSSALAMTIKDYQIARPELRPLLGRELSLLNRVPGQGPMKNALENALSERPFSASDLVAARNTVAEDPTNVREIENLKMIETKIGHPLMPSYLDARISHLQKGKSL